MARVTQLVIKMENRPGALAQICSELAKVAVNISAIMATTTPELGSVRVLATPLPAAKKVLDTLKVTYEEQEAVTIHVTDRPGALGRTTRKLADAGINIDYVYGSIVKDADRALIVMGVSDPAKAAKLL
jgi:hypothetical protein